MLNSEYLNKKLKLEEEDKINSPTYRRILEFRKKLPAFSKKDEILETVKEHNIVLISGETGALSNSFVFIVDILYLRMNF